MGIFRFLSNWVPLQVIQIDEAALREGLPLRKSEHAFYLDWAVHSFRITNCGVQDTTQVNPLDLYVWLRLAGISFPLDYGIATDDILLTDPHPHVLLQLQRHHPIHH